MSKSNCVDGKYAANIALAFIATMLCLKMHDVRSLHRDGCRIRPYCFTFAVRLCNFCDVVLNISSPSSWRQILKAEIVIIHTPLDGARITAG